MELVEEVASLRWIVTFPNFDNLKCDSHGGEGGSTLTYPGTNTIAGCLASEST